MLPHTGRAESLRGENVRRAGLRQAFRAPRHGFLGGAKLCSRRVACLAALTGGLATVGRNGKRAAASREAQRFPGKSKALKTEPHERYRDETSPEGIAGCKPSRACETLRTEGDGCGIARGNRTRGSASAVGAQSPGGRVGLRELDVGTPRCVALEGRARLREASSLISTSAARGSGRNTGKPPKRIAGSVEAILDATSAARTSASPRNPTRERPAPARANHRPQGRIRTAGDRSTAL